MTPEHWQRIKEILSRLDSLSAEERSLFLNALEPRDATVVAEIRQMVQQGTQMSVVPDVLPNTLAHQVIEKQERHLRPDEEDSEDLAQSENQGSRESDETLTQLLANPQKETVPPEEGASTLGGFTATGYEILEELGRGGMGIVYRARHRLLDIPVAIKFCEPGQEIERFKREAKLLAKVRSPHAVVVHDFDILPDGRGMLVMDWIEGSDLATLLRVVDHPLPECRVQQWMRHVCEGMHAVATQGIVHRDLKPSNILVDHRDLAHVADFGLARSTHVEQLTVAGGLLGTPYYMAPEQAEDPRHVDSRTDIYSFGATFYHVLTGKPAFEGDSAFSILYKHKTEPLIPPQARRMDLSDKMNDIIERCLAKNPSDRFSSFAQISKQLRVTSDVQSPWTATEDPEEIEYLDQYQTRRRIYLARRHTWNPNLDVYTFPEGRTLRITQGDIVEQTVEAVVSSDTSALRMEWGVSAAIRAVAGEETAREAVLKAPVRPGRASVTSGGKLPARLILHGVTVGMVKNQIVRPSRNLIAEIVTSCIYLADSHAVRSIAFPLLGTGAQRFPRDVCLDTTFQVLVRLLSRGLTSVRDVRIILFQEDL